VEAGEKAHQTRGSVGGISWGGWAGKGWEKRGDGERTGRNGRGGVPGGVRARRERGVGKGARGVVQFRVGITLDFRGDVATSLPSPSPSLLFSTSSFSPLPSAASNPTRSLPHLRVLCFAISAREGHPPLVLQGKSTHPDYLGDRRDRSFHARYPIYRPRHGTNISRIGWYFSFCLRLRCDVDVAIRRWPVLWRRTGINHAEHFLLLKHHRNNKKLSVFLVYKLPHY